MQLSTAEVWSWQPRSFAKVTYLHSTAYGYGNSSAALNATLTCAINASDKWPMTCRTRRCLIVARL